MPFYRFFFGGGQAPTKIDKPEKSWYPCSNLSNLENLGVHVLMFSSFASRGIPLTRGDLSRILPRLRTAIRMGGLDGWSFFGGTFGYLEPQTTLKNMELAAR